jgi:hypothetical protein
MLLGFLGGLVALCRWQNVLFLAAPVCCELLRWQKTRKFPGNASVRQWLAVRAIYLGVAFLSLIPQIVEWKAIYGKYLTIPQGQGFLQFPPRFILNVLFSTQHGWFIWTPITLVCVVGLLLGCFRFMDYLVPWVLVLFAEIAIIGAQPTNWHCKESFGIRSLTCSLPIAAIGLAVLFWLLPKKAIPAFGSVILLCGLYTVLFAAQYRLDLLPRNDRLVAAELIRDKFFMREAEARAHSAAQAAALLKKGMPADAVDLLNGAILQHGQDRILLKTLAQAYSAAGDGTAAQETNGRVQQFLEKRLF